MPDITDAEFREYNSLKATTPTLEAENRKLKDTAENTKLGLKAGRDEVAAIKAEKEAITTEFETFKTETEESLKQYEGFDDLKQNAEKWTDHEKTILEKRTESIEKMKETLGEDFIKNNESFLDGLPEDKVETYLKSHVDKLDPETPDVSTGAPSGGMKPNSGTEHKTEFDEAIGKGDAMAALAAIPSSS